MKTLIRGTVVFVFVVAGLAGCLSLGRGHGPLDSFAFLSGTNSALARNAIGAINERPQPQEIEVVVPPGTDLQSLVATLSLNKEAAIAVISSGRRVVQKNGVTPNDFSVPVIYSIAVPGEKEPWNYKVFVRQAGTNALLSTLVLPRGSLLRPAFNPAVHAYALEVPFATTGVRIEARGQSPNLKSVSIDGAEAPGGVAVVDFQTLQERTVTIETVAEDGVTRERYMVRIGRSAPDTNSALDSLDLEDTALFPAFSPTQTGYQALVPFSARQLVVRAQAQSDLASVSLASAPSVGSSAGPLRYRGDPAESSGALVDFSAGGRLSLVVTVTAQDGTMREYLVDIRRSPPDRNADLISLVVSAGAMAPAFSPRIVSYRVALPGSVEGAMVSAIAASPVASVTVAEEPGVKPAPRQAITVAVAPGDMETLSFLVRAEDGSQRLYRVQIERPAAPVVLDGNALLQTLRVTGAQLQPAFDPSVTVYDLRLAADVESVALAAAPQSRLASVTIDGEPSGNVARTLPVQAGTTRIVVVDVTAQSGAVVRYALRVTREKAAPARPPGGAQPGGGQSGDTRPVPPPPADSGSDHVVVTAKNLKLGPREGAALAAVGSQAGVEARISVRYYRTNEVITQYTTPVEVQQLGVNLSLTLAYRSSGVALNRERLVEVETVIPTSAGHFLYYTEAQAAGDEVRIELPFLISGTNPRVSWPPMGSPVKVAGYVSRPARGKDRAQEREDFVRNAKGEYAISVQIVDARTNASYGTQSVLSKPGQGRDRTFTFGKPLQIPEGATVKYLLTAKAKNGKVWTASGTTEVWTTAMSSPAGFQPVLLFVEDELAAADAPSGRQ